MDNIQYDPEQILKGFSEDVLKELAKKLKRRIRLTKNDIIQEILSPPKGKPEAGVKVWQEINWQLRKELETFSEEVSEMFSSADVPIEEQFKVGYMFTLSANPEIRAIGEELYCQAEKNKKQNKEDAVVSIAEITAKLEASGAVEIIEVREAVETTEVREAVETMEVREAVETIEVREAVEMMEATSRFNIPSEELITEETEELQKRIRTLENKLRKALAEGLRTKEQFEKLKIDMVALRAQWVREKEETGKHRNKVRDLEGDLVEKEKEIEVLKQKLEQRKTFAPSKAKDQIQLRDLQKIKSECGEIDLASYQGRKALIFAERDNDVDIRLNALGIIPIWAMEIDWNRPRRRMSTCEIVLYKMNDKRLKKLDEIRDIAKYWNIPCNELVNI